MSDFNFGGTDEESAEIKQLNAEVVRQLPSRSDLLFLQVLTPFAHSLKILITSRTGRNSFARPRPLKEA